MTTASGAIANDAGSAKASGKTTRELRVATENITALVAGTSNRPTRPTNLPRNTAITTNTTYSGSTRSRVVA